MNLNEIICFCGLKLIGVENVPASYVKYEGMQLTLRVSNDNLDLGWTTNGCCILRSLILDESEPNDTDGDYDDDRCCPCSHY